MSLSFSLGFRAWWLGRLKNVRCLFVHGGRCRVGGKVLQCCDKVVFRSY